MTIPRITVGRNVASILGFPITEVLDLPDRRGPTVTFRPHLRSKHGLVTQVYGTQTVFGLVLHRIIIPSGAKPGWLKWTISEPVTGCAIARGGTRQDALDNLALRVAYYGGEVAFQDRLEIAISNFQTLTV